MTMEPIRDWKSMWAYYDGHIFAMISCSGSGNRGPDDTGALHFLPANSSDWALGEAAQDCLAKSRFLLNAEWEHFFSNEELKRKDIWLEHRLAEGMHAKSYRKLKEKLMFVSVDKSDDLSLSAYADRIQPKPGDNMTIHPSKNVRGKNWDNIDGGDRSMKHFTLRYPCPASELGALIREAFKRCEGLGRDLIDFPEPLPD
jgi:hypothetical protein